VLRRVLSKFVDSNIISMSIELAVKLIKDFYSRGVRNANNHFWNPFALSNHVRSLFLIVNCRPLSFEHIFISTNSDHQVICKLWGLPERIVMSWMNHIINSITVNSGKLKIWLQTDRVRRFRLKLHAVFLLQLVWNLQNFSFLNQVKVIFGLLSNYKQFLFIDSHILQVLPNLCKSH
jgi:hypothetical protein